jgi:hypothetical protein
MFRRQKMPTWVPILLAGLGTTFVLGLAAVSVIVMRSRPTPMPLAVVSSAAASAVLPTVTPPPPAAAPAPSGAAIAPPATAAPTAVAAAPKPQIATHTVKHKPARHRASKAHHAVKRTAVAATKVKRRSAASDDLDKILGL